jgi:hypothetical protein
MIDALREMLGMRPLYDRREHDEHHPDPLRFVRAQLYPPSWVLGMCESGRHLPARPR